MAAGDTWKVVPGQVKVGDFVVARGTDDYTPRKVKRIRDGGSVVVIDIPNRTQGGPPRTELALHRWDVDLVVSTAARAGTRA